MASPSIDNKEHPLRNGPSARKVVIKIGGSSLSDDDDLDRFSRDVSVLLTHGLWPIIVHGGGPEISQEMEHRGLKVRKVLGLRITDDEGLKVAMDVLASMNAHIVASLQKAGVNAIGMPGSKDGMVLCTKMPPITGKDENGKEVLVDLGNVGEVALVDPSPVEDLCSKGAVPVIYPICAGQDKMSYNVNADTVAAHIARSIGSNEMVLMTDVPGILKEGQNGKQIVHRTTIQEIDQMINAGTITGGMVPKVEACRVALQNGVRVAYMINGKEPHSLIAKLIDGAECGTSITSK